MISSRISAFEVDFYFDILYVFFQIATYAPICIHFCDIHKYIHCTLQSSKGKKIFKYTSDIPTQYEYCLRGSTATATQFSQVPFVLLT